MDCPPASVGSTLSWNTFLSRTSVSTLTCAAFSGHQNQSVHGLEDVIRAVGSLHLRRYVYEDLAREEILGEGETYLVEKAVQGGNVVAVKHLKISSTPDDKTFRRRLTAVAVEAQIMRHSPLRAHPNLPTVIGYGWNVRGELIIPFLVVEYAPLGTLREYIQKFQPPLPDVEILLGDVASALEALHVCGIVHGDIKLDNVLVFPSWDRPAKALAKLTDFGHALILNDHSKKYDDEAVKYGGTAIYNAPEVRTQDVFPINRTEVWKCDIWAFGLLVWEACIGGGEYIKYLAKSGVVVDTSGKGSGINAAEILRHANFCLPTGQLGTAMFLRIVLHKTIQEDPSKRAANMRDLPLFTRWNNGNLLGLEADLALHFEVPTPTYEMFRLDTGKEILWDHQRQIFQGFERTHTNNLAKQRGPILWQIALCYHVGFGTTKDAQKACEYSEMAKSEFHPLAMTFGHLLDPRNLRSSTSPDEQYASKISGLLRLNTDYSKAMPSLVKAFFNGNSPAIFNLLSQGISLNNSAVDGCSPFHWLFMFQDAALEDIVKNLSEKADRRLVNLPMCSSGPVHDQWPLQLSGSPLAVAISVNSLPAVKALLSLGADPLSPVYSCAQFPKGDFRSSWTAFHVAAKYHCSDILAYLLQQMRARKRTISSINSLACALSASTALERLAMHGPSHTKQLDETVRLIGGIRPLEAVDAHGRTGLMMAIDFEDHQVIEALLCANRGLVKIPFRSPNGFDVFTYPIHFSAQIAARRDVPETLTIPKLLNSRIDDLNSGLSSRDNMGKTPLHLAVTGPSSVVASWILEKDIGLIRIEDVLGRTPLHYCASAANFDLLLKQGASVNHVDKRGMAALHGVCYLGASDLVACLLKWKPRLDLRDKTYGTPLHCGVISGSIDVVMALVEKGAPLNAADANGNTAVHVAAKLGRHNILRLLIQQGADISLQNTNGRDPEAIALDAAGNVGILSILKHQRRDSPESQSILNIVDEGTKASSLDNQVTGNDSPDFLWDEDSMGAAEQNELMGLSQSANDDLYTYEEQQEVYYQRKNKSKTLDHIASTVLRHFPSLRQSRRAITALVKLLSVFLDDMIWQSNVASRMIELIARAAHEFACIVLFHFEEARRVPQRIKAWVDFLTKHDGILLENKKQLDWFWSHMEGNDPVSVPDQVDHKVGYWPNKNRFVGGVFRKQIPLQSLLCYMKEAFPFEPAYRSVRNVQDRKKFDLRNMVEGWEEETENVESSRDVERRLEVEKQREVKRKEAEKNDKLVRALEKQEAERMRGTARKLEVSEKKKGKLRREKPRQDERKEQPQPEKPKLDDVWRQKVMSYSDHVNLAINLIATLVMDRKPQTAFPGRQKSDIENMARWEVDALKMHVPNYEVPNCSGTLFDFFPQLSGRSWREESSRDYRKWKDEKALVFFREEYEDERVARVEFFAKVHKSCIRRMENEQSDVDDVDIDNDKASKAWLKKAKGKLKVFKAVC